MGSVARVAAVALPWYQGKPDHFPQGVNEVGYLKKEQKQKRSDSAPKRPPAVA